MTQLQKNTKLPRDIAVLIPTLNNLAMLKQVLTALFDQTLLPLEIVISDSSSNDEIQEFVETLSSEINISYIRAGRAYKFDKLLFKIKNLFSWIESSNSNYSGRAYPYEATNLAINHTSCSWVAFLDAGTLPTQSWLEDYWNLVSTDKVDIVFGNTMYLASTKFQKILRACTYGEIGHETAPGTLMSSDNFRRDKIIEGVRSGGDVEWKQRLKTKYKYLTPEKHYLFYDHLPTNILSCTPKFFFYQLHSARLDIQNQVKDIYLSLVLIFSVILIPKWNAFVGWENSPLFIPHITKIYLISLSLVFLLSFIFYKGILRKLIYKPFAFRSSKYIFFIALFYIFFRWNAVMAGWVEESVWYIPNITKIFLLSIFAASFIYRGLYFPLKHKISHAYLFPLNWLYVALVGLYLDVIKSPGYILGSILKALNLKALIKYKYSKK